MSDDIRVVFTASQSWYGRAIRKLTKSKVSHVYIEFPIWGRQMAAESTVGGTRLVTEERARHNVVCEYRCKTAQRGHLIELMKFMGTPYDYANILLSAWIFIFWNILKLKIRAPLWSTKAQKCSELVWEFFTLADLVEEPEQNKELLSPEDIRQFCEEGVERGHFEFFA